MEIDQTTSSTKGFIQGVKDGYNPPPRNDRNQHNLEVANNLGLNEEAIISSNPEVTEAAEQLDKRRENTIRTVRLITSISAILGAASTLLMFKKSQGTGKWAKRGVTAIFTGGGAGLVSGMMSSAILDKGDVKKYTEFQDIESVVIEKLAANARNLNAVPKEFSETIMPRDKSHTTQAISGASQRGASEISR